MAGFSKVREGFSVAGQLSEGDFARAAEQGFALVINNRPDGEAAEQLSDAQARALAEQAGLAYVHAPIVMSRLSMADIEAMAAALEDADGPVLAYCASGARSTALWALTRARAGEDPDDLLAAARGAGKDIEGLRPLLQNLSGGAG